jgi:hypothetical protein
MTLTNEQKLRELLDFAEEARRGLKYATEIANEFYLRETETKPVQIWAIALGALTFDVSGAALELVRGRYFRTVEILVRSLLEYLVRVHYFSNHEDSAENALADADKVLRIGFKAKDSILNTLAEEFSQEERDELKAWLERTEKPAYTQVRLMFDDFDKAHGKHMYEHLYALGSSYVHGTGMIFYDVIQPFDHPRDPINWQSQRFGAIPQANWVIFHVLQMLGYVEKISDRGSQYQTLYARHSSLIKALDISEDPLG